MTTKHPLYIFFGLPLRGDPADTTIMARIRANRLLSTDEAGELIDLLENDGYADPRNPEEPIHQRFVFVGTDTPGLYTYTDPTGRTFQVQKGITKKDIKVQIPPHPSHQRGTWKTLAELQQELA